MQEPRNRTDLTVFKKNIGKLEKIASNIAEKIYSHLLGTEKETIIAYYRQGYLPASITYWVTATLNKEKNITMGEAGTLAYYLLVYREAGTSILYTTTPHSPSTIHFLQAAKLTGYKVLLVTIDPLDERIRDILAPYSPIYIKSSDELEAAIIMSFAAFSAATKLSKELLGRRGRRLYEHSKEGFTVILDELIHKYNSVLQQILRAEQIRVTSTKLLEPASLFFVETLRRLDKTAYYEPIDFITGPGVILLLSTSVEDYLIKERRFKLNLTGSKIIEISLNTDPLEAQIYISLLAYFLQYYWKHRRE